MMAPGKKRKADPKDKEVAQGATKRRQSANRALQRASRTLNRVTSNRSVDDGVLMNNRTLHIEQGKPEDQWSCKRSPDILA